MTRYLLNAFPTDLVINCMEEGDSNEINRITEETAFGMLSEGFESAIGFENYASLLTKKFSKYFVSKNKVLIVTSNRITVETKEGDIYIVAGRISGTRLKQGELYTDDEVAAMEIGYAWFKVPDFDEDDDETDYSS